MPYRVTIEKRSLDSDNHYSSFNEFRDALIPGGTESLTDFIARLNNECNFTTQELTDIENMYNNQIHTFDSDAQTLTTVRTYASEDLFNAHSTLRTLTDFNTYLSGEFPGIYPLKYSYTVISEGEV